MNAPDQLKTAKVVFTPSGKRGDFPIGTPVLQAARSLGVDIDSVCGGRGLCGRCQVLCPTGQFAKHGITVQPDHLNDKTGVESRFEKVKKIDLGARRLSCHTQILGDLVVDVPADSQVHKQVVRKSAADINIEIDPSVKLLTVRVREPDMHDPTGDLQRLNEALRDVAGTDRLTLAQHLWPKLQTILRDGQWTVTAAVHEGLEIIGLWPGEFKDALGVAVDIGSTTIAAHLCRLDDGTVLASSGIMNPQIRFGEDLMSRVSYVMMNPGGEVEMAKAIRESLNELTHAIASEAGYSEENILSFTFVGNPVMHHLFLGISPVELGGAPFALTTDEAITVPAISLDIKAHPGARAYVLPCIAGHVGADTAGVVLAERPDQADQLTLLVDVGTNAEIVLGNKEKLLACSSPTGPAFEGAQISGGQRAAPGAIERVRIDKDTLEPRFSVIGVDAWSDSEEFAELSKSIGITGICGSGIIEVVAEMYLAGIIDPDGVIDGAMAEKSPRIVANGRTFSYVLHDGEVKIVITQNDIRQIQLAKAALYAGVKLLMDQFGVTSVERIRLAGAFGSHIDTQYAMILGLIPDCELKEVSSAGNAAGSGARMALLNQTARADIERLVRAIHKVETAIEPKFQEHFVDAMAIPHKTDPFTHLSTSIVLPEIKKSMNVTENDRNTRRRRRPAR
ncbi:MAG: DUF4445 domain-containing protein [Gammaproteobacteria bacterium]|nr:DUF4445 domain-containing protein [Gammaproteobacteria bacterium]